MTEKYKIYIPEDVKLRLINDAELFEFYKSDGSVNLNAFLKELIISYFDMYREQNAGLQAAILADLANITSLSNEDADYITDKIMNTYMKKDTTGSKSNAVVTLTVSRRSYDIIQTIENNLLTDISLSQYLKDMFLSYLSISRNDREKIIFKEIFDDLSKAIDENRKITFSSSSSPEGTIFNADPYMTAASKEEQCNYLLCYDTKANRPRSFRISRIKNVFVTFDHFEPDRAILRELQEAAIKNPQSASLREKAAIRLTERGKHKFVMVTKNRPDVEKTDGDIYYFNWPLRQLEEYFKRFGKDAVVLEPEELRNSMKIFYERALRAYR